MENKISSTIEDYLGVIYVLERDGEPIQGVRLADLLGVSAPTVTNTLKRMIRDGLLEVNPAGGPRLTESGMVKAQTLMRRHPHASPTVINQMLEDWLGGSSPQATQPTPAR